MRQIIKALVSWPALVIEGIAVIIIAWPWAGHLVSYFFGGIFLAVLVGELISKLLTDDTVSGHVRDASVLPSVWEKVRFTLFIVMLAAFFVTLILHFCVRLF